MARKNTLPSFQNIGGSTGVSGDMSTASITSLASKIEFMDNIGVQLSWTGSPVGNFQIQVSVNHNQDINGNVITAGTWVPLLFSGVANIASSVGSPIYIDLNQMSAPWIRVVYTKSSGSGTLTGHICGKEV